jgi:hypothetical protein
MSGFFIAFLPLYKNVLISSCLNFNIFLFRDSMIFRLLILFGVLFISNIYSMRFRYTGRNATLTRTDSCGTERTVVVPQVRRNRSFALSARDVERVLNRLTPEQKIVSN